MTETFVKWLVIAGQPDPTGRESDGSTDAADPQGGVVDDSSRRVKGSAQRRFTPLGRTITRARLRRRLRRLDRPIYGLEGWSGPVSIAGYGFSAGSVSHLKLMFGPTSDPHANVDTVWLPYGSTRSAAGEVDLALARTTFKLGVDNGKAPEFGSEGLEPTNRTMLVDGCQWPARVWDLDPGWGSVIELPDSYLGIRGFKVDVDDVSLTSIDPGTLRPLVGSV